MPEARRMYSETARQMAQALAEKVAARLRERGYTVTQDTLTGRWVVERPRS